MHAPLYSTVALLAEILVSVAVLFVFYQGYKRNRLLEKIAIGTLIYETIFDISYMVYRSSESKSHTHSALVTGLGVLHGTLSLAMFLGLIAFFVLAIKNYRRGVNYFFVHKRLTSAFLFFWMLSVVSGVLLYFIEY